MKQCGETIITVMNIISEFIVIFIAHFTLHFWYPGKKQCRAWQYFLIKLPANRQGYGDNYSSSVQVCYCWT